MIGVDRGETILQKHREQKSLEREKLAKHRKKCFAEPAKYLGIVVDGMDKKKPDSLTGHVLQSLLIRHVSFNYM